MPSPVGFALQKRVGTNTTGGLGQDERVGAGGLGFKAPGTFLSQQLWRFECFFEANGFSLPRKPPVFLEEDYEPTLI